MARTKLPPEERRAEIIAAATRLFMEKGFESTSVSDIVKAVGVAQGTFYWYFKSKDEVLNAVAEAVGDEASKAITELAGRADLNAVEKLKAFEVAAVGLVSMKEPLEHFHRTENTAFHDQLSRMFMLRLQPCIEAVIRQGVNEGFFDVSDARRAAGIVLATFHGLPHELSLEPPEVITAWLRDLMDFILKGLGYHQNAK